MWITPSQVRQIGRKNSQRVGHFLNAYYILKGVESELEEGWGFKGAIFQFSLIYRKQSFLLLFTFLPQLKLTKFRTKNGRYSINPPTPEFTIFAKKCTFFIINTVIRTSNIWSKYVLSNLIFGAKFEDVAISQRQAFG